jgi:predicted ATP-dependent protease
MSGGCLRDCFNLVKEAAEFAMDDERKSINQSDYHKAYLTLKREYKASIADYQPDGQKEKISVEQFYQALAAIANNRNKTMPDETNVAMVLRQNLMVLGYNGEGWCDVHPVVRDILAERGLLN